MPWLFIPSKHKSEATTVRNPNSVFAYKRIGAGYFWPRFLLLLSFAIHKKSFGIYSQLSAIPASSVSA
jgi:hypothetical protein